jgi:hypothetical protein
MSQENVEVVERAIAAVNARDIDGYLDCCTEDVELETPLTPIAGVYNGSTGIRRFLTDIEDAGPDFRIEPSARASDWRRAPLCEQDMLAVLEPKPCRDVVVIAHFCAMRLQGRCCRDRRPPRSTANESGARLA